MSMKSEVGRVELPCVCHRCRALKFQHLGEFKSSFKHRRKVFVCHACMEKEGVRRVNRVNNETPPERTVRLLLTRQKVNAEAEVKIGRFIYDFAIYPLRLLLELDSKKFHSTKRNKIRDAYKDKNAQENDWAVVHIQTGPFLEMDVERAMDSRKIDLGLK